MEQYPEVRPVLAPETFPSAAAPRPGPPGARADPEVAAVGIAQFDRDGRLVYANPQLVSLLGGEAALRRAFSEAAFPDAWPMCAALDARLAAGEIPGYRYERRLPGPGGAGWRRVTVSALRDAGGKFGSFVVFAEDVSPQKAGERARRETEDRLRAALEASGTGTIRWEIGTFRMDWDENLDRLLGLEPVDAPRTLGDFLARVHPADRRRVTEACWLCAGEGADFDEEFRVVTRGGAVRWLYGRASTRTDEEGVPAYVTGACVDVTRRREAEATLERQLALEREAHRRAEDAIRQRDEVLAIVAHDLRNPLSTISLSASALLMLTLGEHQRARYLGVIQRAARGMDLLIGDLLDVTRIEAGTLALRHSVVDAPTLLAEAVDLFEQQARRRGIALVWEVAPEVAVLHADRERLAQAISNLVGNALKFTPDHGRIWLRTRRAGAEVEISVTDTGSGIPAHNLPRVFDRFWQADRTSRTGAGLGLAIVKGIAEAHGGRIEVESTLGAGTTFRILLPGRAG